MVRNSHHTPHDVFGCESACQPSAPFEPRKGLFQQYRREAGIELYSKATHTSTVRPLPVLAVALTQGVQLCLVQSLRDVRDQIGRVFDADRQRDRGVENTYFLAAVSWNAGGGHACGQGGKGLGARPAPRPPGDWPRV